MKFNFLRAIMQKRGSNWCMSGKAFVGTLGSSSPSGAIIAHAEYFHQWAPVPDVSFGITIGSKVGVGVSWDSGNGTIEGNSTVYISK